MKTREQLMLEPTISGSTYRMAYEALKRSDAGLCVQCNQPMDDEEEFAVCTECRKEI